MLPHLVFILFFLLPSALVVTYYLFLIVMRLAGFQETGTPQGDPRHSFLIVIPAHDEEPVIARTLESCFAVDYPADMFDVTVIADNCQDSTARIARRMGAECLVRSEPDRPGKGFALAWAFDKLIATRHDAYLVLDADCPLDRHALSVLDACLQRGETVLQANHRVSNPDASPISYAASVGRRLEYDLFFAPKSRLGLAVLLVGTGMAFHRSILVDHPWTSHSCAEDTEHTIDLIRSGHRIMFVSNAYVECHSVVSPNELHVQRQRWASGNMRLGKTQILRLIAEGIGRRNLMLTDLGWTLMIVSRPLVLVHLMLTVAMGVALFNLLPDRTSRACLYATLGLLPAYAVYLLAGICSLGVTQTRIRHLLRAPLVVVQLAMISLRALFSSGGSKWVRTPRRA